MTHAGRIVLNTAASFGKLIITAGVSLITMRLVFNALGEVDFGLYSVVGGGVALLYFINGALAISTQRHLAYSLGGGDIDRLKRTFGTSLMIHTAFALVLLGAAEWLRPWILETVLQYPSTRETAVLWVYQIAAITAAVSVMTVPFGAVLLAHEALLTICVVEVAASLMNLCVVVLLPVLPGDRLVCFVGLNSGVILQGIACNAIIAWKRFPECRLGRRTLFSKSAARAMLSYSSWSLFGAAAIAGRGQGTPVLINSFFGPVANAAYGVATTLGNYHSTLSQAIMRAVTSPIVKSEGAGDRQRMLSLSLLASKYSFLISCLWVLPFLFEMPAILEIWLGKPPAQAADLARLLLAASSIDLLTAGFMAAIQATGRIGGYQCVVGLLIIAPLIVGYVLFRHGMEMKVLLWAQVGAALVAAFVRALFVWRIAHMPLGVWMREVVFPAIKFLIPATIAGLILITTIDSGIIRMVAVFTTVPATLLAGFWFAGSTQEERDRLVQAGLSILRNRLISSICKTT